MMGGVFTLELLAAFISIRMTHVFYIVPTVYVACVLGAISLPLLMHMGLPHAAIIHEDTKETLRFWKLESNLLLQRKHLVRNLASLHPCVITAGLGDTKFCEIKGSSIAGYYSSMLEYVITLLMSIRT